jgi:hypothetical protein
MDGLQVQCPLDNASLDVVAEPKAFLRTITPQEFKPY